MEKTIATNSKKIADKVFYILKLRIDQNFLEEGDINNNLGLDSNYFFEYEKNEIKVFRWNFSEYTEGASDFFGEVLSCLKWLVNKKEFVSKINSKGGRVEVIIALPGFLNMRDLISREILRLSVSLGVVLTVEVDPRLHLQVRNL